MAVWVGVSGNASSTRGVVKGLRVTRPIYCGTLRRISSRAWFIVAAAQDSLAAASGCAKMGQEEVKSASNCPRMLSLTIIRKQRIPFHTCAIQ